MNLPLNNLCYKTPFQVIVEKIKAELNITIVRVYHTRNSYFPELTRPNGLNLEGI
jgi:hypothetical protein